jgi:glucose/arabinose dehydrogenase
VTQQAIAVRTVRPRVSAARVRAATTPYGWPVTEGEGNDPRFVDPIVTWAPAEASPSGITVLDHRIYIACLRAQRLYRVGLDGRTMEGLLVGDYGRLRHVATAPDGSLWAVTSNRDKRGNPTADDDRILRLTP